MSETKNTNSNNIVPFVKEVTKYFMDFLETDFHKRRNPKRNIQYRNSSNLLLGINLNKYPRFSNALWKSLYKSFNRDSLSKIKKGAYKSDIPPDLLQLIELQINQISDELLLKTINEVAEIIDKNATTHKRNYDHALNTIIEETTAVLRKTLVTPFISSIEKSLVNLHLSDENDFFLMEDELSIVLTETFESKISEILKQIIAKEQINPIEELLSVVEIGSIKNKISTFFQNYQVGDLFAEFYEIDRNRTILDKQEFYFYFCDIKYDNVKYPVFYIPISVEKDGDSFYIEFDSQIYINKKALEYIAQEYNRATENHGSLQQISERILYLANYEDNLVSRLQRILDEIVNYFELDESVSLLDSDPQNAKSYFVNVTNTCYISLFDKSDEALVNDYEEILELLEEEDSIIANAFNVLINDFIHNDPIPVNPIIEEEWDEKETVDKLVFSSPVPLNSEQLQILQALNKQNCKYVTVEGPPGTGKSHTITAIAFDAILKGNSVLILSDKKEALDVVEDKITETLNKVRHDKNFQNPILRLGKTGNTYSKILSSSSIEQIKTHFRAIRKEQRNLHEEQIKRINSLKEDLDAEIISYQNISLAEITELTQLEYYFEEKIVPVDLEELIGTPQGIELIDGLRSSVHKIVEILENSSDFIHLLGFNLNEINDTQQLFVRLEFANKLVKSFEKLYATHGEKLYLLKLIENISSSQVTKLEEYLSMYKSEKLPLVGYLFKGNKVKEIDRLFQIEFGLPESYLAHNRIEELQETLFVCKSAIYTQKELIDENYNFNYLAFVKACLINNNLLLQAKDFSELSDYINFISETIQHIPNTASKLCIMSNRVDSYFANKLLDIDDNDIDYIIRYLYLQSKIYNDFVGISESDYSASMKALEELTTTQTTYEVDRRLIDFYENNKATATTLRNIIRSKQRFPKEEFLKLKSAFPCILAGIRDYAEFIPLEPEIFDLVIIDEASQVSIAQAFPALLRAKQVLILGDKKQFSNVKSAQARSDTNHEYLNSIQDVFKRNVATDQSRLVKLEKFNIRTSILDFFEFITNYNTQLRKHFRGYKELISYSNKYFYKDDLQVMKIRGKPIHEVLEFTQIEHDGKQELVKNTNTLEADYIIGELLKLKEQNTKMSVGIITPHTNQQKLLVEKVNELNERDYLYKELKLKIMTFDTCQGEERDIIYYSMVASTIEDRLWGVFIKDINSIDIEDDGQIKAQRLNVGFSRAKEKMHFILSKPIQEYRGSIGEALRHYSLVLSDAIKEKDPSETDPKSEMEPFVLNWFYQTHFWNDNKDSIEFIPSFELGKYLKQLDRLYDHPEYIVDFLLTYVNREGKEIKIIIEYDGFKEHFVNRELVNEFNYEQYYSDQDLYRQKVLESYGYRFLRINKFNLGSDPITTLNDRIYSLVNEKKQSTDSVKNIQTTINSLNNGEMKECPKCKEIRSSGDFNDPNLITGVGRFCKQCKGLTHNNSIKDTSISENILDKNCPKCGSRMVLRNGQYGRFYGCSKFPYCRGTRKIDS